MPLHNGPASSKPLPKNIFVLNPKIQKNTQKSPFSPKGLFLGEGEGVFLINVVFASLDSYIFVASDKKKDEFLI
jgi:hypothetical protein